jgi:hypothetical protein
MPPGWDYNGPIPGIRTIDTSFDPKLNKKVDYRHLSKHERYLRTEIERKLGLAAPKFQSFVEFEKKVSFIFLRFNCIATNVLSFHFSSPTISEVVQKIQLHPTCIWARTFFKSKSSKLNRSIG